MTDRSFRERVAEAAMWVIVVVGLGALRSRWLADHNRKTWRQHFWQLLRLGLVVVVFQEWLRPITERSERARADLEAELGRPPTIEEQMDRIAQPRDERR